jgi:hypothetical protein
MRAIQSDLQYMQSPDSRIESITQGQKPGGLGEESEANLSWILNIVCSLSTSPLPIFLEYSAATTSPVYSRSIEQHPMGVSPSLSLDSSFMASTTKQRHSLPRTSSPISEALAWASLLPSTHITGATPPPFDSAGLFVVSTIPAQMMNLKELEDEAKMWLEE